MLGITSINQEYLLNEFREFEPITPQSLYEEYKKMAALFEKNIPEQRELSDAKKTLSAIYSAKSIRYWNSTKPEPVNSNSCLYACAAVILSCFLSQKLA